jgi:hypothetical protein
VTKDQELTGGTRGGWRPHDPKVIATVFFFQDMNDAAAQKPLVG